MYKILKPFLFRMSAERAHKFTIQLLQFSLSIPGVSYIIRKSWQCESKLLETSSMGLTFKNPVGLAAGFDKDGKYYEVMSKLGFGFIEIGTVTPLPQDGNDKPRLFRLPKDEGLINRMGFNNEGVDALVERLKKRKKSDLIIGGNIGKNKLTSQEKAVDDYTICFTKLHAYVDYFVVNVSSPNTPGLRDLQDKKPLTNILSTLMKLNDQFSTPKPILLKISPDLTKCQLDDIIEIVRLTNIQGIIATNTTVDRKNLLTDFKCIDAIGNGGLSGKPIQDRSTQIIHYLRKNVQDDFIIIGVGGIDSPKAAQEKIKAGASLIQVYSSMIYKGPYLIKSIKKSFLKSNKKKLKYMSLI